MRPTSRSLLESRSRNAGSVGKSVELGIDIVLNGDEKGVEITFRIPSPNFPCLLARRTIRTSPSRSFGACGRLLAFRRLPGRLNDTINRLICHKDVFSGGVSQNSGIHTLSLKRMFARLFHVQG
jgi:hypothetical protein